jgi:hypothetical protein
VNIRSILSRGAVAGVLAALIAGGAAVPAHADTTDGVQLAVVGDPSRRDALAMQVTLPTDPSDYTLKHIFVCDSTYGATCAAPSDLSVDNPSADSYFDNRNSFIQSGISGNTVSYRTGGSYTIGTQYDLTRGLYATFTRNSDGAVLASNVLVMQAPTKASITGFTRNADNSMRLSWNTATERGIPLASYRVGVNVSGQATFFFRVRATPGAAGSAIPTYDIYTEQPGTWVVKQGPTPTSADIYPIDPNIAYDIELDTLGYGNSIGGYDLTSTQDYTTLPATPLPAPITGQVSLAMATKADASGTYVKATFPDAASGYTVEQNYTCAISATEPCTDPTDVSAPGSAWRAVPGYINELDGVNARSGLDLALATSTAGAGYVIFKRTSDGARFVSNVLRAARPEAPTRVKLADNGDGTATASWDSAVEHGDPVHQYLVQVYIDGQPEFFTRINAGIAPTVPGAHLTLSHSVASGVGLFPFETYEAVQGATPTSFTFKPSTDGVYTFNVRARSYAGYTTPVLAAGALTAPLTVVPPVVIPTPQPTVDPDPVASPEPTATAQPQPTQTVAPVPVQTVAPVPTPTVEPTKPSTPVVPVKNLTTTDIRASYTATSTSGAALTWQKVPGATRYDVVLNGKLYTTKSTKLTGKVRYGLNTVKVRPANSLGVGKWSPLHRFHTVRPNAVATPKVKAATKGAKITWYKPRDYTAAEVNRYLVQVQQFKHGRWVVVRTVKVFDAKGAASAQLTKLTAGAKYRVQVKAFTTRASKTSFTSVWASNWSKTVNFKAKR